MKEKMKYRLGIDTGGTFTDFTLFCEETGRVWSFKVPSSSAEKRAEPIFNGIEQLKNHVKFNIEDVIYFGYATTIATNTLIEQNGAKIGLITTRGFKDLLEIGRQKRPDLYNIDVDKPPVLIKRDLRKEVSERVLYNGEILIPLDEAEVNKVIKELSDSDVESIVVLFIFSYLNPKNEKEVKTLIKKIIPNMKYVYISSEVLPEFREYERLSTVTLCGYLGPLISSYLEKVQNKCKEIGMKAELSITKSNGGLVSWRTVNEKPIETALSGPASGVMAAAFLNSKIRINNFVTFDMGGTSADFAMVVNGIPKVTTDNLIVGYPSRTSMIDIKTIGAGGGTIAWADTGGALKVGPNSAGAIPGPACYGKGGKEPTVTDANLFLGRINPENFLGGRMKIYPDLSQKAIQEKISEKLGMDLLDAARGIVAVVNSNMVKAIRSITVEKGYNPKEFNLLGFGGAGALHAVAIAQELGIKKVIIPENPSTFSSLGLLVSDFRSDFVKTNIVSAEKNNIKIINHIFDELELLAQQWLDKQNIAASKRLLERHIDMRYQKQNYELCVDFKDIRLNNSNFNELLEDFHQEHFRNYGYKLADRIIELVNFRVTAYGIVPKMKLKVYETNGYSPKKALKEFRKVYFEEQKSFIDCPIYTMEYLAPQNQIEGPAIIEQQVATIIIPPLLKASMDKFRNIIIYINDKE